MLVARDTTSLALSTLGVAVLALAGPDARAQAPAPAQRAANAPDSLDAVRQARAAQRDFERVRRANLPVDLGGGGGPCDERIGRFCYWYDPSSEPPSPESEKIGEARELLLRDLAAAAGQLPGDDWIIGQLVRYLAEHGRADSAVTIARACQGTRWWCAALEGFARHVARDYVGADRAFSRALRGMPAEQRCDWTDLSQLLGDDTRPYRKLSCTEREAVGERIWWLAHPLYSQPGNDLRTEHYARQTMALLLQHAETAHGTPWGDDQRELVVRFGWPTHWSRSFDRPGTLEPPPVLGHEPSPSFWFFPTPAIIEAWDDITEIRWEPARERPPTRYAPPYAAGFASIARAQFARFRRGDTTLTIAAFDLTPDSALATRPVDVRLAVAQDPATSAVVGRVSPSGPVGVVLVRSGWRPTVLSLEAIEAGADTPWVARRRAMVPPDPAGLQPRVSDILLFAPGDVLPESLDDALATALPTPVARADQQVGLYWEIYDDPHPAAPVEIAVTASERRAGRGAPYPVGRPECPLQTRSPVTLRWREEPGSPRGRSRSVVLDLQSLPRGHYIVAIQVSVAGVPRGCSNRELQID